MRYLIESSHMCDMGSHVDVESISQLRRWVQAKADAKKVRVDRPAIGEVTYRYQLAEDGTVNVVHAYFIGRDGKRRRFMRLRREQESCVA